jgi:ATP-dependent DNA ligase
VVVVKDGRTNFSELQAALAAGRQDEVIFYVFDLLYLEGFDLRGWPQIERKRVLKRLFDETRLRPPILLGEHMAATGAECSKPPGRCNYEAIVSKKADAPYRSDRNEAWQKVKCAQRAKFPVVGFVKDPTGVAALHLGREGGKGPGLHGQGRHGLVTHRFERNPEATRHRRQSQIEADEAEQGSPPGSNGNSSPKSSAATSLATGCCVQARSRACRRHESGRSHLQRRRMGVQEPSRQAVGR